MRTVTYGAACSLDGFIAGPDGAVDWLHFSDDVREWMQSYWPTVDTIVMGRKTWDFAAASEGPRDPDQASLQTYVFSRTLETLDRPNVHLVRDDPGGFVRALKEKPGKGICVMGGGELACSLLAAGVVDEVGVNIHPILLGSGVPLFRDAGRRIPLRLLECHPIDGGCVIATYKVVG